MNLLEERELLLQQFGYEIFVYIDFPNYNKYVYIIAKDKINQIHKQGNFNSFKEAFETGINYIKTLL